MTLGDAALGCAARGWPVFPVAARGKAPLTRRGLYDASTDLATLRAWWAARPDANIGVRTGVAFDVLDVDGDEGVDELEARCGGGDVPPGPVVLTPGRGLHIYVAPTGKSNRVRFAPGFDWRGIGGYVVVPPSIGANGVRYRWWPDDQQRIEPCPGWLLAALNGPEPARGDSQPVTGAPRPFPAPRGSSPYAAAALDAESERVASAVEGTRNDTLVRAAFSVGQLVGAGQLDPGHVASRLLGAALACGLNDREARRTITSGLEAGITHPRPPR